MLRSDEPPYADPHARWFGRVIVLVNRILLGSHGARGTLQPGDIDSLTALDHVDRISLTEFHNDFSVLPRISNLYAVSIIEGCGPDDLKLLASIPTLRSLELLHGRPEDLSALGGAKQLARLSLAENEQYRDIGFLANMLDLEGELASWRSKVMIAVNSLLSGG